MVRCHGKRSLWAAAAAGVLILATGPAGLAQSLSTDTSVSGSVAGQDAKMSAVIDSLKAAGLVQSNQRAAQAVKDARVSAEVQTQTQAPAPATDMTTRSLIDSLKAAGRLQSNQRAAQAVKEANAGMQGAAQAPDQAPGQPPASDA